ncbi:TonB-dependent receptor plug domain-containing protein [Shewanella maritima]|uniref:TonB-dependent receptor plug domain-containing protein n=1 Tax=Shewanella maritima TaxID=2520507 RepID=UPI003735D4AC
MKRVICFLWLAYCFPSTLMASAEFADLDLESLMEMDVQVTSAMRRSQSTFDSASSIYVITQERIQHSGAASVPEVLKMVPGLIVRQLDNNQWAITTRGIASRFSSKMLVMINGQSLYTPKFAAVYWETINVPLYDIERIEVIRGQGGLLWASNANNGVINIITKNSLDSRGLYSDVSTGNQTKLNANLRYGDVIGENSSYRVFGHYKEGEESDRGIEFPPNDSTEQYSYGFRFDYSPTDDWFGFIQADTTHSKLGQNFRGVIDDSNENTELAGLFEREDFRVMGRLEHRINDQANQMLQTSLLKQKGSQAYLKEKFRSIDIDYQMNFLLQKWQLDWGLNFRDSKIHFEDSSFIHSDKNLDDLQQYGGFLQAQYSVIPEQLHLILGVRYEHNDLTDWESQPLAKVVWKPLDNRIFWGSISKSARIPSLIEFNDNYAIQGVQLSDQLPAPTGVELIDEYHVKTFLNGNDEVKAEQSTSFELGYRETKPNWSLDVSLYYTESEDVAVIQVNPNLPQFVPAFTLLQQGLIAQAFQALQATTVNFDIVSQGELTSYGGDAVIAWFPNDSFNAEFGYSYNDFEYTLPDDTFPAIGDTSTTDQIFVKTDWHIFQQHNIFAVLRVEDGEAYNTDDFTSLDITWNWQLNENLSLALTGTNLFAGTHIEYKNTGETYTIPNYIDESYSLKFKMQF